MSRERVKLPIRATVAMLSVVLAAGTVPAYASDAADAAGPDTMLQAEDGTYVDAEAVTGAADIAPEENAGGSAEQTAAEDHADSFVVRFDPNGGVGVMEPLDFLESGAVPDCGFSYEGMMFSEWNTRPDGTGIVFVPGTSTADARSALGMPQDKVSDAADSGDSGLLTFDEGGALMLYAQWEEGVGVPDVTEDPEFSDLDGSTSGASVDAQPSEASQLLATRSPAGTLKQVVITYARSNSGGNYGTGTDSMPVIIVATSGSGYMEFFEANNLWPSDYTGTANARYAIWSQDGGQDDLSWRNMSRGTWMRNGITFNVGNAGTILGEHGGADSALTTHFYVDHNGASNVLLGTWLYYPRIYITYDLEGGHVGADESVTTVPQQMKYEGQGINLSNADVRVTGYTFVGWSPQPSGSSEIYAPGQAVGPYDWNAITPMRYNALREIGSERWITSGYAMPASTGTGNTVELHAQYRPNTANIVLDGNGATGGSMDNQELTYDEASNLATNAYSRDGYHWTGWNTEPDGTGTSYTDGAEVLNLSDEDGAVITLYAQWEEDIFTVTVPKRISYTGMPVGQVATSDTYDVVVDGEFGGTVNISADSEGLTLDAAVGSLPSSESLAVSVASNAAPLSFSSPGAQSDTVSMSGRTNAAGTWVGTVNYTCSVEY